MHLGLSLTPFGHDPSAWREGGTMEQLGFDALLSHVEQAEEAGVDFVLLSDRLGQRPTANLSPIAIPFEPTTLVAALSTRVRWIGFVAAASTAQHEPYNLARRFASLDHISRGRTGWLAVPSTDDLACSAEYLGLVRDLWDSWEDNAFVYDKAAARFFEPSKMHVLGHKGKHFSVRGPLNVNRSPQGRPVSAQFLSEKDTVLAAHHAELLLLQDAVPESANKAAADFVRLLEAAGRQRQDVCILANVVPVIAESSDAAQTASHALDFGQADRAIQPLSAARLVGTSDEIADALAQWFEAGQVDGFTILPPTVAIGQLFFSDVMPQLQRRGLIKEKRGFTLRDRLSLSHPAHPAAEKEHAS
ncbi:LLM class flavin-dependent oxidoreductase [Oryzifoliimicrobium ureilyticus]|uniref:LLM class flavin-dependent oxidoreductase n=1 Tax=Oryzifoliimicrobium ureilyticus TaxID=3113724 RepID=UPI003075EEBD